MEQPKSSVADIETGRPEINPSLNATPEPSAQSIEGFARAHGISRSTAYEEIRAGNLTTMKVGSRRLVSREAAEDWRRRMERIAAEQAEAAA